MVQVALFLLALGMACANRVHTATSTSAKRVVSTTRKIVINDERACFKQTPRKSNHYLQHSSSPCEAPQVPLDLFFQHPYCKKIPCGKRETCMLVAENLLAYYGTDFDVVFLTGSHCHQKLRPGNLTQEMTKSLLSGGERLVGLTLNGTDLVQALHQGIFPPFHHQELPTCSPPLPSFLQTKKNLEKKKRKHTKKVDHFPTVAGVKFNVKRNLERDDLEDVRVLSSSCEWPEIDLQGSYSVLTTEELAMGGGNLYPALTRSSSFWETGHTLDQVLWDHALSTCEVQQPVPHPGHAASSAAKAWRDESSSSFLAGEKGRIRHAPNGVRWNVSQVSRWIGSTTTAF